jgi:hypothetical protein
MVRVASQDLMSPSNGDHTEEMLIMNHEVVLRAEVDYRQRRFDEAKATAWQPGPQGK